jgi:glycosyltransferase involved in cell wall biosynthesis
MRLVYLADAPYIHTRRWVEQSARSGWDTHVISFRPGEIDGATVHYVSGLERLGKLRYLAHARRVRRLIDDLQPDMLHALHLTSYGFLGALSGARPLVTSVWGIDVLKAPRRSPLHGMITRYALRRADHVTATGMRLARATLRYTPPETPVTVVPYGIDLARFQPRPPVQRDETAIGSVGRLSREKGLDVLLSAAARLVETGSSLRVLLAGDGPERGRLTQLTERLGIVSSVEFRGEVEHEQVPHVLAELDIFVMPSRAEGFGVAALEAQAMELPVVASDVDGLPDVVENGRTGVLVPPGEPDALAAAIAMLAESRDLRTDMGRAGRALVEARYRWEENVAQMERVYKHVLDEFTQARSRATVAEN